MISGISPHIAEKIKAGYQRRCFDVLLKAYEAMKSASEYKVDWEEEQLTANLIRHMENTPETMRYRMDITPEFHVHSRGIELGEASPKTAPRVDLRMCMWYRVWGTNIKFVYTMEAKNLSESDWDKSNNGRVNARRQQKRYIATGMDHYMSGHYPEGCLIGYVVQGTVGAIVNSINQLLVNSTPTRKSEALTLVDGVDSIDYWFRSSHGARQVQLNHFLLKL